MTPPGGARVLRSMPATLSAALLAIPRCPFPLEVFDACRDGLAVGYADECSHLGHRLGRRVGLTVDDAVAFASDAGRSRLRHRRRVVRPGPPARAPGVRPQLPDAVRRPDPQRGRDPDDRGRRDLALRRRQYDHLRRAAPTCARSRARTCTTRQWTLHAAAEQEFDVDAWVPQYEAGSRKPPAGRDARAGRSSSGHSTTPR